MVAVNRYTEFKNVTSPAAIDLTSGPVINIGYDWSTYCHKHTFLAAEVGTGAGQTQDTTSTPTTGFLIAKFVGPQVQEVVAYSFQKDATPTNVNTNITFRAFIWATAANYSKVCFGIDNSVAGESKLYLLDQGDNAATRIAAGDTLRVIVGVGVK